MVQFSHFGHVLGLLPEDVAYLVKLGGEDVIILFPLPGPHFFHLAEDILFLVVNRSFRQPKVLVVQKLVVDGLNLLCQLFLLLADVIVLDDSAVVVSSFGVPAAVLSIFGQLNDNCGLHYYYQIYIRYKI